MIITGFDIPSQTQINRERIVMKQFLKNYWFLLTMLLSIVAGCITGAVWPGASALEPLGTVFINLMFCVVVPMVFCSISSAIANMPGIKRAGKLLSTTVITFFVTASIASVIMYTVVRLFPVFTMQPEFEAADPDTLGVADLLVNFFTKPDFAELLSRRAILPLIIAAILFGFGVQMSGGAETKTAAILKDLTNCIMKTVKIITYYAPIGFFGFFASLVAVHGSDFMTNYARAIITYYVVSIVYMIVFFPIYARFGGGKGAVGVMLRHIFKPAAVSFGTCSSVATIPTNMEEAESTGISSEVSEIVIPMGATMHMDGSAMSAIIKVAFLFGMFGMPFDSGRAILAIVVAVFSSVAMSGIPGGGGTGELVLCSLFFPSQISVAFPIALAIGDLVDPPATMVNAAGDYVATFIVSRFTEGKDWLKEKIQ